MTNPHGSFVIVPRRPPTSEELSWVLEIVSANPAWADTDLGSIQVVSRCTCGCRSVAFEVPTAPQNAKLIGHQGLAGEISLGIKIDQRDDAISVLLHFAEGSLSLLEVIWYNFPDPVPATWVETSHIVSVCK